MALKILYIIRFIATAIFKFYILYLLQFSQTQEILTLIQDGESVFYCSQKFNSGRRTKF